ncbi:hypothetical protein NQD34_000832, partial [Periophthalmus magnuspinnatus]
AVLTFTFGRLKGRWRTLMKRNDSRNKSVKHVVAACVVLYNFCESLKVVYEDYHENTLEQPEVLEQNNLPGLSTTDQRGARDPHLHEALR